MEAKESCLTKDIEHMPDTIVAEYGQCSWHCRLCGQWITEWEDSQP